MVVISKGIFAKKAPHKNKSWDFFGNFAYVPVTKPAPITMAIHGFKWGPFYKRPKIHGFAWGHFTPGGGVITLTTLVITGSRVHLVRVDQFFFGFVDASHPKRM